MTDYKMIAKQILSLAEISSNPVCIMANASALLFYSMEKINWAGFYIVENGSLLLGPFQGKSACVKIEKGRGVCGTAWAEDKIQLVDDVHSFPGHIACDSASKSEIVLPIHRGNEVAAVLDMDSPETARFSTYDKEGLSDIVCALEKAISWDGEADE